MTLNNYSIDNYGYTITYVITFFILSTLAIISFVQSAFLKVGRTTHLTLFGILIGDTVLIFIGRLCEALSVPYNRASPTGYISGTVGIVSGYYWSLDIAFCFQNSLKVYLLWMWLELFITVKHGNLAEQAKAAKRWAIYRNLAAFAVFVITFFTLVAISVGWVLLGSLGFIQTLTASFACSAIFLAPIVILAIIRWRAIYNLMKDTLATNSKNTERFMDLTKASIIGIFSFLMDNIFYAVLQKGVLNGDLTDYVLLSYIPNTILCFGAFWYFTPMRKSQYEEKGPNSAEMVTPSTSGSAHKSTTSSHGSITASAGSIPSAEATSTDTGPISKDLDDDDDSYIGVVRPKSAEDVV